MSPVRRIIPIAVVLAAAACDDATSTAPALTGLGERVDLDLVLPRVTRDMLVTGESRVYETLGPDNPARVLAEHEAEYPGQEEVLSVAGIWNARTGLKFWGSRLEAWGEHDYVANKGKIEVTASLWRDGVSLGSQSNFSEETYPFVPWWHHIGVVTSIDTDVACGLSGDARSQHGAWWEAALGTGPSTFGAGWVSSWASNVRQDPCPPPTNTTTNTGGGGGGGGVPGGGSYTCYIWWRYDMDTGDVLDAQLLYCTEGG